MFAFLMTLLALPLLGLISIPLILSAWLTISFAMFTLLLRFAVVYTELCYAMVLSFFTLPTSSSSFLTFAPSEPATPAVGNSRRNSGYGLIPYRQNNDTLSSWALNALHDDPAKLRKKSYARSMVEAHHLPTTPFMGLPISGDERRDFEGVGGWRSYPDPSRASRPRTSHSFQEKPLSSDASSPAPSATGIADVNVDVDADERAWLSLNDRLELPSQVITFGIGSSMSSAVNSPTGMDFFRANSHTAVPNSSRLHHSRHSGRNRHHHRSHTTSALTASDNRTGSGLSLAFSTRPDPTVSPPAAQLAPS
ncbi:hypothetical protein N7462_007066 [Penicillium macrosclerotiorum]|uniref:uncharacterized protein n=1 Tax=Penicillium macrosclerotiorum TaxID=303699 RepID=UPI0025477DD1|nr:uncharacterized protein N7462_007066 [Penicillium macrosclerotiorum]KAJ5678822.1 hypothetical protein N7462_007066 [Penicillium macrosclerotiorum]